MRSFVRRRELAHERRKANLAEPLATKSLSVCTAKNSPIRAKNGVFQHYQRRAVIRCGWHPTSILKEYPDQNARSTGLGNRRATDYQRIMSQFTPNMTKAAHRNWAAAERLKNAEAPDRATAGYLYGIAAECSIKALFRDNSWTTDSQDGPVYAHFPSLRAKLRDAISGRGAAQLVRFTNQNYMKGWAIDIRYSDGTRPDAATLDIWRADADEARAALT